MGVLHLVTIVTERGNHIFIFITFLPENYKQCKTSDRNVDDANKNPGRDVKSVE